MNGAPSSGSAAVQVTARSWTSSMKTLKDHSVIATAFTSKPDSFGALGHTTLSLPHDSNINRWLRSISDDGPNNAYVYLLDLPPVTTSVSQVNTKAINDTSSFYRIQEARKKKISGFWYCGKDVVWPGVLLGLSVKHEGAITPYPDPDTLPNSHPGIFRRHVDSLAYLRYEPIVIGPDENNALLVTNALLNGARRLRSDGPRLDQELRQLQLARRLRPLPFRTLSIGAPGGLHDVHDAVPPVGPHSSSCSC